MRLVILKSAFLLLLSMLAFSAKSQFVVSDLQAVNLGDRIHVSWTLEAGSICNGIKIFRGADSLNLTEIELIEGVCGNENEPRYFEIFDETPISGGLNYYRLQFGTNLNSDFVTTEYFSLNEDNYVAYPNPTTDVLTIRYFSGSNDVVPIKILDINGALVTTINGKNNQAILSTVNLKSGMYFFEMELEDQIRRGKFLVSQ